MLRWVLSFDEHVYTSSDPRKERTEINPIYSANSVRSLSQPTTESWQYGASLVVETMLYLAETLACNEKYHTRIKDVLPRKCFYLGLIHIQKKMIQHLTSCLRRFHFYFWFQRDEPDVATNINPDLGKCFSTHPVRRSRKSRRPLWLLDTITSCCCWLTSRPFFWLNLCHLKEFVSFLFVTNSITKTLRKQRNANNEPLLLLRGESNNSAQSITCL